MKQYVQTVLGPVAPEDLGATIMHEHLLVDMTHQETSAERVLKTSETGARWDRPAAGWEPQEGGPGTTASYLGKWQEPLTLENRGDFVRNWFFRGEYRINSIETASTRWSASSEREAGASSTPPPSAYRETLPDCARSPGPPASTSSWAAATTKKAGTRPT